jgi:hypothetical protein
MGVLGGRLSYVDELGLPFETDLVAAADAIGFQITDVAETRCRYPNLPPYPEERPRAGLGGEDLLIGFGLFLASRIGEDIVEDVVHDVYERIVKANLKKLWEKLRHEPGRPPEMTATFDHWFDGSGVVVRVVVHLGSENSGGEDSTTSAVAAALRQAVIYLHGHPITHRVLTYHVHDGSVARLPTLSEPIEPVTDST